MAWATGLTATAVAKALGARCREAGGDVTVDGSDPAWKGAVRAVAGRGVNVVYDPVGGDRSEAALRRLAPGERLRVVGFVAGIPQVPLDRTLLLCRTTWCRSRAGEVVDALFGRSIHGTIVVTP